MVPHSCSHAKHSREPRRVSRWAAYLASFIAMSFAITLVHTNHKRSIFISEIERRGGAIDSHHDGWLRWAGDNKYTCGLESIYAAHIIQASPDELQYLSEQPVRSLILEDADFEGVRTGLIEKMTTLQLLYIKSPTISEPLISEVAHLPSLRHLAINATGGDTQMAILFNNMRSLHSLVLMNLDFGDAACEAIGNLHNITELTLYNMCISDNGVEHIGKLTNLSKLVIVDEHTRCGGITDHGLSELARLSRLQHLDVSYSSVSDMSLSVIAEFRSLEFLSIADSQAITDNGLQWLCKMTNLKTLDVRGTSITPIGAKWLQECLKHCKLVY